MSAVPGQGVAAGEPTVGRTRRVICAHDKSLRSPMSDWIAIAALVVVAGLVAASMMGLS